MTERGLENQQREALRQQIVAEARKAGRVSGKLADVKAEIERRLVLWRDARRAAEEAYKAERLAEAAARKAALEAADRERQALDAGEEV